MENLVSQHKTNAETVCTFANPWWAEILVLVRRSWKNIKRTPELFWMRLATVSVTGFVLATIFWRLDHTPLGVQVRKPRPSHSGLNIQAFAPKLLCTALWILSHHSLFISEELL
jgi:hypothetical protein